MAKKATPATAKRAAAAERPVVTPADVLPADSEEAIVRQSPDVLESRNIGGVITTWLVGMVPFFLKARALESEAIQMQKDAEALTEPTNEIDDEKVQEFVLEARRRTSVVMEHWGIAQQIHALHRRLTTRRSVATDALERAQTLAQNHHNQYAEKERRRAAAEQERLRQAALLRAREEQEQRAREAEDQAMALEADAAELSDRERLFVDAYVLKFYASCGNAADSAARAGYKNPDAAALQLMKRPKIVEAIEAKRQAESLREQAQATRKAPTTYEAPRVTANISRAAGSYDLETHNAEILDLDALIAGWKAGELGIPDDLWAVDPGKLKQYAETLREKIETWPGVRYVKRTTTVGRLGGAGARGGRR